MSINTDQMADEDVVKAVQLSEAAGEERKAAALARSGKAKSKGVDIQDDKEVVRKTRLEHAQCVLASLFGRSKLVENPRTKNKTNKHQYI